MIKNEDVAGQIAIAMGALYKASEYDYRALFTPELIVELEAMRERLFEINQEILGWKGSDQ